MGKPSLSSPLSAKPSSSSSLPPSSYAGNNKQNTKQNKQGNNADKSNNDTAAANKKNYNSSNGSSSSKKSKKSVASSSPSSLTPQSSRRPHTRTKPEDMFDPDNLALSKKDVLKFCDDIIKKWQEEDPVKNTKNIYAMTTVRTGILWTDEDSVRSIWKEIIKWVYGLLYSNAIAHGQSQKYAWTETFSRLQRKT